MNTNSLKKAIDDLAAEADLEHADATAQIVSLGADVDKLEADLKALEARVAALETEEPPVDPPVDPPVPPTTLWPQPGTAWPYGPSSMVINQGFVTVKEPNKTLNNFLASGIYQNGVEGLVATNGKIDGKGTTENGIQYSDYKAIGVEVTGTKDGFKAHGDVLIENCWVHDLTVTATSHNDGVQISGGTNVTIKNTRFEATAVKPEQKGTAAIFAKPENDGTIGTVTVDGCYFNRWGNFFIQTSKSNTNKIAIEHLIVRNCIFGDVATYVDWADTHRIDGVKKITWENNRDKNGNIVTL